MHFSALACCVIFVCTFSFPVLGLNKNDNHKYLPKVVTRIEDALKNLDSIFHGAKPEGKDPSNPNQPKQWAVLVAGSSGYYNYRHQVLFLGGFDNHSILSVFISHFGKHSNRLMSAMPIKSLESMEFHRKIL